MKSFVHPFNKVLKYYMPGTVLEPSLENSFCKGPDSKYFRLYSIRSSLQLLKINHNFDHNLLNLGIFNHISHFLEDPLI